MNLSRIMSNIYGENSSQSFDTLKHKKLVNPKNVSVKYLDEPEVKVEELEKSKKVPFKPNSFNFTSFTGGAKDKDIIYNSAEYIDDKDLKTFIHEFYLHYLVNNPHRNSIFIVPNTGLKKMVSEVEDRIKKSDAAPGSVDASKAVNLNQESLAFKSYIFDVYGKDSPNNNGYEYQISQSFPEEGMNSILRRTNRASEVYYFKFSSKNDIKVSTSDSMTNAESLKFIGKCDNECYILKGNLPENKVSTKKSNIVVAEAMSGGSKRSLVNHFKKLLRKHNNIDDAAYEFVGSVALAEAEGTNSLDKASNHMAKMYSGDYIHSAFSVLFSNEFNSYEDMDYDDDDLLFMHESINKKYKPLNKNYNINNLSSNLKQLYQGVKKVSGNKNKIFMDGLSKIYNKAPKYIMYADIATSIVKNNDSEDGFNYALGMINDMDDTSSDFMSNSLIGKNMYKNVFNSLNSRPFISLVAKSYRPILVSRPKKKQMRKRFTKGNKAFDDDIKDESDKPFSFEVITTNNSEEDSEAGNPTDKDKTENKTVAPTSEDKTEEKKEDEVNDFSAFY